MMEPMDLHPQMLEAVATGYAKHFAAQAEQLEEDSRQLSSAEAVEALEQARFFRSLAGDLVTPDSDQV